MKRLFIVTFSLLASAITGAADPSLHTYRGEVAGVVCTACSAHVEEALSHIPGVKSVKIVKNPKGGLPQIELTATVATITRQDAVKALGEDAKSYDVQTLTLIKKQ